MSRFSHTLAAAAISLAALTAPARAEEIYLTGFGHVFSLGICSIGPGRCVSYLFVESTIADLCQNKAGDPVRVVGHSMGASAAIKLAREVSACGRRVEAAAFLDPLVHPKAYGLPRGTRSLTLYSPGFAGAGEGQADAESYAGGHIGLAFDPGVHARVRVFLNRKGGV